MTEIDVVVRKAGNSIDLRVPKREARRLRLVEGRTVRISIEDVPDFADLAGILRGRFSRSKLHAATNDD